MVFTGKTLKIMVFGISGDIPLQLFCSEKHRGYYSTTDAMNVSFLFSQCCFWQGLSRASKCFCCASNCTGGMSTAATEEAEDVRLTHLFTVRSDRDVAFYCLWWNFWILFLQRCSASRNLRRIKLQGITGLYCPKASVGPGAKSFGPRPGLSERVGDWIGSPRARSLRGAE